MKKWFDKIKMFVKENYIACTIVGSLILVIIASLIIVSLIKAYKNKIEISNENHGFYQYFDTSKNEFDAKVSMENDMIVSIKSDSYQIYENSPIYYGDKEGIIIPKKSSIIFYHRENLSYQLPKFSELLFKDGINVVKSNGKDNYASSFFIYDGLDTYITSSKSLLKVNGKEINLSAYGYVIANYNYVTYYDYETKEIMTINESIKNATLTIGDVAIDLLKDVTVQNGKLRSLSRDVSKLEIYVED